MISVRRGWAGPLLVSCTISLCLVSAEPLTKDWSYDILRLKNGIPLKGLILEETATTVKFQNIRRNPGRPTVTFTSIFSRTEIDKLEKLSDAEREILKNRVQELDPNGDSERTRMEKLDLKTVDWNGKKGAALRYDSDYFSLIADGPEELVRRSAVRLEQIYTAYSRFLPARYSGADPTVILLIQSNTEYQKHLKVDGKVFNPAFYDPETNRIVVSTHDLLKLGEDLGKFRKECQKHLDELRSQEQDLRRLYANKKQELSRHLQPIKELRENILNVSRQNDALFDRTTQQLFRILYHEAFHAYVGRFVYPANHGTLSEKNPGELPRWLNEGLAQIFETAIVEAGEIRIGHAERERLQKVREALRNKELLPLKDLLSSGPKQFIVLHRGDQIGSDRAYITSWGLAFYLIFERKLFARSALDAFVFELNQETDAVKAFEELIGQPLETFEKEFHLYLQRLQPDGTALLPSSGKP